MTALFSSAWQQSKRQQTYSTYSGDNIKICVSSIEAWKAFVLRMWCISRFLHLDNAIQPLNSKKFSIFLRIHDSSSQVWTSWLTLSLLRGIWHNGNSCQMKTIPLQRLSQSKEERGKEKKKKGISKRTHSTPTPLPFSKTGVSFMQTWGRTAGQTKKRESKHSWTSRAC